MEIAEVTSPTAVPFPFEPYTAFGIYGPSRCGKSTFIRKLLQNKADMFKTEPKRIMYCYGIWSEDYHDMEKTIDGLSFRKGLPELSHVEEFADGNHNILIFDDLMSEICKNTWTDKLFTMCSHHLKLSIMFISQNLFPQSKNMRNISLNLSYLILFRSPRDQQQLAVLGTQLGARNKLIEAYKDAVSKPYTYLLIDLTPSCGPQFRWRTSIFPEEDTVLYL
jgi:hypothetical protein